MLGYDRFLQRYRVGALVRDDGETGSPYVYESDPITGQAAYLEQYAYFQGAGTCPARSSTWAAGQDVLHMDGGYTLNGQTWGISQGDIQAGASAFANVEVRATDGSGHVASGIKIVFGGVEDDVILGGNSADYLAGGGGDDHICSATAR